MVMVVTAELTACAQSARVLPPAGEVKVGVEGIVTFVKVDGGCWVLDTKYGRLQAVNLDRKYQVEQLRVVASVRRRSDLASTCMVGDAIVTISEIAKVAR
jgi:hypothetical protein